MTMVLNPTTGQWEDDGTPVASAAPPVEPPPPATPGPYAGGYVAPPPVDAAPPPAPPAEPAGPPPPPGPMPVAPREAMDASRADKEASYANANAYNASGVVPAGAVDVAPAAGAAKSQTPGATGATGAQPKSDVLAYGMTPGSPGGEVTTVGKTGLALLQRQKADEDAYASRAETRAFNQTLNANEAADAKKQSAQQQQESLARSQAIAAAKEQAATDFLDEAKRDGAELASMKIDPNRYWNSKSTAERIAIQISAAFARFGAGFQGRAGEDPVMDRVQRAIDADIASQEKAYAMRSKSVEAKRSLYGQLMDKYNSKEQVEAVLRSGYAKSVEDMVDAAAASSKAIGSAQAADDMKLKLSTANNERLMGIVKKLPATSGAMRYTVNVGGVPVVMDGKQFTEWTKEQQKLGIQQQEADAKAGAPANELGKQAIHMPDGSVRFANSEPNMKTAAEKAAAYQRIDQGYEEAMRLRKEIAANALTNPAKANAARQELERVGFNTAKTIETAGGQGILREGEVANALRMTTGFTNMQPGADNSIKQGRALFQREYMTQMDTLAPLKGSMRIVNGVPRYTVEGTVRDDAQGGAGGMPASAQRTGAP